jgi:hypothetical protein
MLHAMKSEGRQIDDRSTTGKDENGVMISDFIFHSFTVQCTKATKTATRNAYLLLLKTQKEKRCRNIVLLYNTSQFTTHITF